jgi:mono/diheme cytochrome c family protein
VNCRCGVVLALAAGLGAADRASPPWDKYRLREGQALYRENCAVCHDIDKAQSKKLGPSFYRLFQRERMPLAKVKPSREYIKVRVQFGGPLMPGFRQRLSAVQMETLIDYIASK